MATGALSAREQLPPVKVLADRLAINFLTVRKAYKELESEGLVEVRHGEGTFVAISPERTSNASTEARASINTTLDDLRSSLEVVIANYEASGLSANEMAVCVEELLQSVRQRAMRPTVIFTECNQFQITEISALLEKELGLNVVAILTDKLVESLPRFIEENRRIYVVTTGFHVTEVRVAVGTLPIEVNVLITNLNPQTRRRLEAIGEKGKFSFICRDRESTIMYKDLLKSELGFEEIDMTSCTIYETSKVHHALRSADAVLASPPVFEAVTRLAPKGVKVFNLFERVDPMSLKVIKDRILS